MGRSSRSNITSPDENAERYSKHEILLNVGKKKGVMYMSLISLI